MAALEQLNFDVILNDDKFNKRIAEDVRLAEKLNVSLSKVAQVASKIKMPTSKQIITSEGVKNAEKMLAYLTDIERKLAMMQHSPKILVGDADALNDTLQKVLDNLDKIVDKQKEDADAAGRTKNELAGTVPIMRTLAQLTGITFGVVGLRQFVSQLVEVTGNFEVQKMALTSMLQSAGRAEVIFRQLKQNALESPYTFMELTQYAKQLTAFNIDAHKLVDTEKMLADVAAGLGVDMGRIILAYGQIKSAGVLKGQELRQLTEAGVPILESLANQIGEVEHRTVSLSEVFDRVSKKQIPFEMVEEGFRRMTSEGGKFYKMQEVLVETLQGKIGKLRDVWQQSLYDIGNSNSTILKGAVDILTYLAANLDTVVNILAVLIPTMLSYKVAVQAVTTAHKILNVTVNKGAAVFAAIIAVISTAAVLYKTLHKEVRSFYDDLADLQNEQSSSMATELAQLDHLWDKYSQSKEGTEEYLEAKKELMSAYPEYIRELQAEGTEVNNTANYYDKLRAKIEDTIKARFREQAMQNAKGRFDTATKDLFGGGMLGGLGAIKHELASAMGKPLTTAQEEILRKFLLGEATEGGLYAVGGKEFYDMLKNRGSYGTTGYGAGGYATVGSFTTLLDNLNSLKSSVANALTDYKNALDAIDQVWGSVYSPIGQSAWGNDWHGNGFGKGKPEAQKDIETMIDTIKALQSAYKDLKTMGLDDETILGIFGQEGVFGHVDAAVRNRTDYWQMLREQAEALAKYDPEAATRLLSDIGEGISKEKMDAWKENYRQAGQAAKEAAANTKSYREALLSLQATARGAEGEGFMYDINKALADFNTSLAKNENDIRKLKESLAGIDLNQKDAVLEMLMGKGVSAGDAEKFWNDFVVNGENAIDALSTALEAKSRAAAQNKINSLAAKYISEAYGLGDIDLSHLGSLSITELERLRSQLKAIGENIELTEDLRNALGGAGLSIETFTKKVQEAIAKGLDKLDEAEKKALIKTGKLAFDQVKNLTKALGELGEVSANNNLSAFADSFEKVTTVGSAVLNGFKQGDWIGALIAGVGSISALIIESITEAEEAKRMLADAAREAARANLALNLSNGIFGSNAFGDMQAYIQHIRDLEQKNMDMQTNAYDKRHGRGYYTNEYYYLQRTGLRNTLMLSDAVKMTGHSMDELYDKYGNLNRDVLQDILDNVKYLDAETTQWLKDAIAYSDAYAESMEKVKEALQSIYGDIAASAADKIINQWIEAGNAALDYADILDEVAKRYAKMLIQYAILGKVLTPEHADEILDMFMNNKHDEAMATIAGDMEKIAAMEPFFTSIMQAVDPYLNKGGSNSSNSLGNGIKSITEETASLLASYINAIRADVSYMRSMQEKGWDNIELLVGNQVPRLADYLAQIQANTHDSAVNTQNILNQLMSVISGEGQSSTSVINVQVA